MDQYPQIGRFVRFHVSPSEYRPALVVRKWGEGTLAMSLNLQVFLDGTNDRHFVKHVIDRSDDALADAGPTEDPMFTREDQLQGMSWQTSIEESDGTVPGTWSPVPGTDTRSKE